jgi:hypothetical protein
MKKSRHAESCANYSYGKAIRAIIDQVTPVVKTIRSRSDKAVNDNLDDKWKIVAKRVIAEPTPRTSFEPPRWGIYEYDVVPSAVKENLPKLPPAFPGDAPLISFRKVR